MILSAYKMILFPACEEGILPHTSHSDRLDSAADNDQQQELADSILTEFDRIDAGEEQKSVSIWDGPVAAFAHLMSSPSSVQKLVSRSVAGGWASSRPGYIRESQGERPRAVPQGYSKCYKLLLKMGVLNNKENR